MYMFCTYNDMKNMRLIEKVESSKSYNFSIPMCNLHKITYNYFNTSIY